MIKQLTENDFIFDITTNSDVSPIVDKVNEIIDVVNEIDKRLETTETLELLLEDESLLSLRKRISRLENTEYVKVVRGEIIC